MSLKILFHYPGIIQHNFNSGETKRPFKLLEAFRESDNEIIELTGTYPQRSKKWKYLKSSLSSFDYIYSENSNLPISACNEKKLPKVNSCDVQLFKEASKNNIPIGVYVRDLYWAMKGKKQNPTIKHYLSIPLYKSEMSLYNKHATKIFVPTESFASFQNILKQNKIEVLPPGCDFSTVAKPLKEKNLLYVGSCLPPTYDISPLLKEIEQNNLSLTIVTRPKDQEYLEKTINPSSKVNTLQASGEDLLPLYKKASFFLMLIEKTPYRELAMPLKVLESISNNCPIIAYDYGETAKLIKENSLGWIIQNAQQLNETISKINSEEYAKVSNNLIDFAKKNTWKDRAHQITKYLIKSS